MITGAISSHCFNLKLQEAMDLDILHCADELLQLIEQQYKLLGINISEARREYLYASFRVMLTEMQAMPPQERYEQQVKWSVTKLVKGKERRYGLSYAAIWGVRLVMESMFKIQKKTKVNIGDVNKYAHKMRKDFGMDRSESMRTATALIKAAYYVNEMGTALEAMRMHQVDVVKGMYETFTTPPQIGVVGPLPRRQTIWVALFMGRHILSALNETMLLPEAILLLNTFKADKSYEQEAAQSFSPRARKILKRAELI